MFKYSSTHLVPTLPQHDPHKESADYYHPGMAWILLPTFPQNPLSCCGLLDSHRFLNTRTVYAALLVPNKGSNVALMR